MIFLTVGTWRRGFNRLIKAVDELVGSRFIKEPVIAQTGYSSYKPKHFKVMDFCSPDEFTDIILKAEIIISHAGVGTIGQAICRGKPVVVVPRKVSMGEVDNDHQFTTARILEREGKILVAYEVSELEEKLEEAKTFLPKKNEGFEMIVKTVKEFIDGLDTKKCG